MVHGAGPHLSGSREGQGGRAAGEQGSSSFGRGGSGPCGAASLSGGGFAETGAQKAFQVKKKNPNKQ